jgi:hypothetical protein
VKPPAFDDVKPPRQARALQLVIQADASNHALDLIEGASSLQHLTAPATSRNMTSDPAPSGRHDLKLLATACGAEKNRHREDSRGERPRPQPPELLLVSTFSPFGAHISAPLLPLSAENTRLFLADTVYVRAGRRFFSAASGGGRVAPVPWGHSPARVLDGMASRHRRASAGFLRSAAQRGVPPAFTSQTFVTLSWFRTSNAGNAR